MIRAEASDELKADLDAEFGDIETKAGQNFDQVFDSYGVTLENQQFLVYNPFRAENEFSVQVWNLDGIEYVLWKTNTLNGSDWTVVEGATITRFANVAVITDPNPGEGKVFYRLERKAPSSQ